jgi:murein DD-endopeptidase MepM/ murein hydrolase activator NlpD
MRKAKGRGLYGMIGPMLATALVVPTFIAAPASAAEFSPEKIIFPVVGDVWYTDTWGAPRSGGRTHEGTDIMSLEGKGLPVVAAAEGTVKWIGATCCYLAIDHGGGWETWYIHLDNDTPGTDDGLGWGIAEGITPGAAVAAGDLIGWLGDSGNAEETDPHLHFEIRFGGEAIPSYEYLLAATVLNVPGEPIADPAGPGEPGDLANPEPEAEAPAADAPAFAGYFADDEGSVHEANIDTIFELGITRGCNPPTNDRFCPGSELTRGQIAAFLRRLLDLPQSDVDSFTDDAESIFEDDIDALAAAGIAFGCTETDFCPDDAVRREEMAEFLVRTFAPLDPEAYANAEGNDWFTDDGASTFQASINRLASARVTLGCNPPANDSFCPGDPLTRAQMATFLARTLGLEVTG